MAPPQKSPGEPDAAATSTARSPARLTGLKVLVFAAGAVLMGLEIAGSRVLAPHFGNSIFVWGSLIAIFLMAISVGNYLGGRFADRNPSHLALNSICIFVALWIFGLSIFAHAFCQMVDGLGEQAGPLVASLVLFLAPSIGMGMVSPFAIRLATSSLETIGKISGSLYALSNTGSIAGTMLTTFVLIPFVGLATILKGLGIVLLVVSLATSPGIWDRRHVPRVLVLAVIAICVWFIPATAPSSLQPGEVIVTEVSTPYHNIAVVDSPLGGYRALKFDGYTESQIRREEPHTALSLYDDLFYTDYFHLAFLAKPELKRTAFIGAGGAIGPRSFHAHDKQMHIDVVDIDPQVLALARSHFYLEDDPRIRTIADDGRMFVRKATEEYDCIILDAFTIGGRIPFHLVTQQFFELCRDRMTDDGLFLININSALTGPNGAIFRSTHRTLSEVFPANYVFQKNAATANPAESTNIILVASKGQKRLSRADWEARAAAYESASYVTREQVQYAVEDLVEDVPDTSLAPLFTDDYAPIETMPF